MLTCAIAKWEDIISPWYKKLLTEIKHEPLVHRQQWEYLCVIQAFKERGLIKPGASGIVFAVGSEWLPSYFAGEGCKILATDLSPQDENAHYWIPSGDLCQNICDINNTYGFATEEQMKNISHRSINMNSIPDDIRDFDFCWSLCALEHLGSKKAGLDFIKNSLKCLKPGGWAFHSTEFNIDPKASVYETVNTSFYQAHDIEDLANDLEEEGHYIEPRDYTLGGYLEDYPTRELSAEKHLKIFGAEDHLVTSVRLIVRKETSE